MHNITYSIALGVALLASAALAPLFASAAVSAKVCSFDGITVMSGSSIRLYASSSVPYGDTCDGQTRKCTNGSLSGSSTYSHQTCVVRAGASCSFNGHTIASGSSVTAYKSDTVSTPYICASQARTCTNGTLSGSYTYSSCHVEVPPACAFTETNTGAPAGVAIPPLSKSVTVASGSSVTTYKDYEVAYGSTCVSQARACTAGTLSGSYVNPSCRVAPPASCTFNGSTVASGSSVTAYKSDTVPSGGTCVAQTRVCTNGALSGVYAYAVCSAISPLTAPTTPTATVRAGVYTSTQSVALSSSNGSTIHYTTSATTLTPPTCTSGTVYTTGHPISIATSQTIQAIACNGTAHSQVASFGYIITTAAAKVWFDKFLKLAYIKDDTYYDTMVDSGQLGWDESYYVQGYLTMYEATGDAFYMQKAQKHIDINLGNERTFPNIPIGGRSYKGWINYICLTNNDGCYSSNRNTYPFVVHDAMILYPIVKFALLVQQSPSGSVVKQSFQTIANAYVTRIRTDFIPNWDAAWTTIGTNPTKGYYELYFQGALDPALYPAGSTLPWNQILSYGRFLLAFSQVTTGSESTGYLTKAITIANGFKNSSLSSLRVVGDHYEWNYDDRKLSVDPTRPIKAEDMSHANLDIAFAYDMYKAGHVFTLDDIALFALTFTIVYDPNAHLVAHRVDGSEPDSTDFSKGLDVWIKLSPAVRTDAQAILTSISGHTASYAQSFPEIAFYILHPSTDAEYVPSSTDSTPATQTTAAPAQSTPQPLVHQHLTAIPSLVRGNTVTSLSWNIGNVHSCSITGSDGFAPSTPFAGSASVTSSPIKQQTIYTLTCENNGAPVYTESITVNIVPTFGS